MQYDQFLKYKLLLRIIIIHFISVQTLNVIYELHCKKDSLPYIEETSKTAEARFVGRLNTILPWKHKHSGGPTLQATWTQSRTFKRLHLKKLKLEIHLWEKTEKPTS